jgi:leucyl aminopeptidase
MRLFWARFKTRRAFPFVWAFVATFAGGLLWNCGGSSKRSNGDGGDNLIPAGWDGLSDWAGSRWIVADPANSLLASVSNTGQIRSKELRKCLRNAGKLRDGSYRVRAKFYQGGSFSLSLAGNPEVESMTLRASPEVSEAILSLSTAARLAEVAAQLHGSLTGCTGIEVISGGGVVDCGLSLLAPSQTAITGPVYDETVSIDAVSARQAEVSATNIISGMTQLQNLNSRYALGAGAATATTTVEQMFNSAAAGWSSGFTTTKISHSGATAAQQTVVSSLTGGDDNNTIIVIGSHLDSINPSNQASAPGADDNASGVAILAETMRVLSAAGTGFKRRVEWHAYAAEELGLIGSGALAQSYAAQGKKVSAMLQVDMASWATDSGNSTIHVVTSDTTTILRRSLKDLLTTYLGGDFTELPLPGSGTSDHRSWSRAGFPAVFPFENPRAYNPNMHSSNDTVANANATGLAVRIAKLIVAFVSHHAGVNGSEADHAAKLQASPRSPDIKFAVLEEDQVQQELLPADFQAGGTVVVISAPTEVSAVEICNVQGTATTCTSDRTVATAIQTGSLPAGRNFFYAVFPPDSHIQAERAFAYSSENTPTHGRNVSLTRK